MRTSNTHPNFKTNNSNQRLFGRLLVRRATDMYESIDTSTDQGYVQHPIQFLNGQRSPGKSPRILKLKVGVLIMLLQALMHYIFAAGPN